MHHNVMQLHTKAHPKETGVYRTCILKVGDFYPPPPEEVETLMKEFLIWINSDNAKRLHPIKYAALAHYKLVYIHPFCDGKGRTSRLLMALCLLKNDYPILVFNTNREAYYDALEQCNEDYTLPFIRVIGREMEKLLDIFISAKVENFSRLSHSQFI
ncbi:protein adenylyltransferase FICD-like [Artemia franciscana]|uniref:protein adenylyltransferase FICD-like n=1 Tax=Artemia franciscana TaxID=6661 RepID=UPI0032DABFDB